MVFRISFTCKASVWLTLDRCSEKRFALLGDSSSSKQASFFFFLSFVRLCSLHPFCGSPLSSLLIFSHVQFSVLHGFYLYLLHRQSFVWLGMSFPSGISYPFRKILSIRVLLCSFSWSISSWFPVLFAC